MSRWLRYHGRGVILYINSTKRGDLLGGAADEAGIRRRHAFEVATAKVLWPARGRVIGVMIQSEYNTTSTFSLKNNGEIGAWKQADKWCGIMRREVMELGGTSNIEKVAVSSIVVTCNFIHGLNGC